MNFVQKIDSLIFENYSINILFRAKEYILLKIIYRLRRNFFSLPLFRFYLLIYSCENCPFTFHFNDDNEQIIIIIIIIDNGFLFFPLSFFFLSFVVDWNEQMFSATEIYAGWRDLMDNKSDPRTRDWMLMSSPFPTIALSLTYAYCVKVSITKLTAIITSMK